MRARNASSPTLSRNSIAAGTARYDDESRVPAHTNSSAQVSIREGGMRPQLSTGGRTSDWCRGATYKNPEPNGALSHLCRLAQ